ncbi:MAG: outer membrane protein multidrug efflux system [Gammaproteobacteria bacterium]|jgi:multidrug efflux system outer membrane protein|nr:outer membrane protein multidrug efflux system [Gammaproteobacteria bacterium]
MKSTVLLAVSLLLAACAVGPDYKPPANPPAALVNARSTDTAPLATQSPDGLWWQQFDDPELNSLVTRALDSNLDLAMAIDRVRAARANFSGAEFDYGPHVPLTAGYTHSKEQIPGFGSQRYNAESYTAGFDATWELDLFGHVRRSVEAAHGDLAAEQSALQNVGITVAAEVARNYFTLRSTQRQIQVAHDNIANQQETVRLTSLRFESGRGTELDVQSSRARLKATEATLPVLESNRAAAQYRLAVLLGQRPGALDAEFEPRPVPAYAKALPIGADGGDASALLRSRPDVREAEQRLAAATARVGVATADLFPRVTVSGFVGFLSGDFGHLFSSSPSTDSRAWSIAPSVSWSALDYGTVRARLRASRANADGALANYEKTVLNALEETENAFQGYRDQQTRLKSLLDQAAASRRAAELAALQYREGVTDYVTLLDAQRTQLSAESDVEQTVGSVNISVVTIYKALGGVGQTSARPLLVTR